MLTEKGPGDWHSGQRLTCTSWAELLEEGAQHGLALGAVVLHLRITTHPPSKGPLSLPLACMCLHSSPAQYKQQADW